MLTAEENEYVTRTGPGTPMGNLFRRFWLPAFLESELPERDGNPLRTRILGEDLVAYRDTTGKVGMIDSFCPHRRAPMFFGRNEESGLRCVYHGWKFDETGACIDMPSEPAESNFREKIQIKAYPTYEVGGLIWVYMGPADKMPPRPPQIEWTEVAPKRRRINKWFHESNYLQGIEGDIDTAHISFLHRDDRPDAPQRRAPVTGMNPAREADVLRWHADRSPKLTVMETDYGMAYSGRRNTASGDYYWRVTQWMLPCFSLIPGVGQRGGTAWIPVDDHHCVRYSIGLNPDADLDMSFAGGIPGISQQVTLEDGTVIDTMVPPGTKDNNYNLSRDMQKAGHFSGIDGIPLQDKAMIEGMGYICDRTQEHLGTTDVAVIATRRRLIRLAKALEEGHEPYAASHPEIYRVRPLDLVSPEPDMEQLMKDHAQEAVVPV